MAYYVDMTGEKIGRLTVIERAENDRQGNAQWLCECECGNTKVVRGSALRTGKTLSCGCLLSECSRERMSKLAFKHGFTGKKIYAVYRSMIERCDKPSNSEYHNYGGRGITVCKEWREDRELFFKWALSHGYKEGLEIDRIDNDGNYEPSNCRWVTSKVNSNNMRKNVLLEYNGETHTIAEWADITGISYTKLYHRTMVGKPIEEIFWKGDLGNGIKGRTRDDS